MITPDSGELDIGSSPLLLSVLGTSPTLAPGGFFKGSEAVCIGMDLAKHPTFRLNHQCTHVPLGTIDCLITKPSRKENGSIPKGLEQIQILMDTDKSHNMLLFKKGKSGGVI